jgi:hypothetical protein
MQPEMHTIGPLTEPNDEYVALADNFAESFEAADNAARPAELFHYADAEATRSILENKTLWATDVRFFKDPSEMSYGFELLRSAILPLKEETDDIWEKAYVETVAQYGDPSANDLIYFAACFCEDGDLLSQWRGYTGGGGYSLGFRPDIDLGLSAVEQQAIDPDAVRVQMREIAAAFQMLLRQRLMNAEDQAEEARQAAVMAISTLSLKVLSAKHPGFAEEKEWRLLATADRGPVLRLLRMRSGGDQLIPYMELRPRRTAEPEGPLPITRVFIGPTTKQPTADVSLRLQLDKAGNADTAIERSSIPLIT